MQAFRFRQRKGASPMPRRVLGFVVSLMGYGRARSRPNARGCQDDRHQVRTPLFLTRKEKPTAAGFGHMLQNVKRGHWKMNERCPPSGYPCGTGREASVCGGSGVGSLAVSVFW